MLTCRFNHILQSALLAVAIVIASILPQSGKADNQVIYVCNRGIADHEADTYTANGRSYPKGNDDNDGKTPETAVRTLKKAYELLRTEQQGGTAENNIVVIMGSYTDHVFPRYLDANKQIANPDFFEKDRPATITGSMDSIRNGRLLLAGAAVPLMADTRFERICLHGSMDISLGIADRASVFSNSHELVMGQGIDITGYSIAKVDDDEMDSRQLLAFFIYGGKTTRKQKLASSEKNIIIQSGCFARVNACGQPLEIVGGKIGDVYGGSYIGAAKTDTWVTVRGTAKIQNVYGGSARGPLTGSTHITILNGYIENVYGGSKESNVSGETYVTVGKPGDPDKTNSQIFIGSLYGGNDLCGDVGGNTEGKGSHINVYGGKFGNIYGAGKGILPEYESSDLDKVKRVETWTRPHLAAVWINISGSQTSPVIVSNSVYGGGYNTTVGIFDKARNNRPKIGMIRDDLRPNSGSIWINIGSHVKIKNLVMGSNGENVLKKIPSYTKDGITWIQGFEDQYDFEAFCHGIDVSCVPVLTFNKDGQFHNDHSIDDRQNNKIIFNTPGEMDAENVVIYNFVGGCNRSSMTGDSLLQYTLPAGVLIENQIVGGCNNAIIEYTETEGPDKGTVRRIVGGLIPYRNAAKAIHEQRTQLNIFCQFAKMEVSKDAIGKTRHKGAKIYGGCLDRGVSVGVSVVNLHTDLLGGFRGTPDVSMDMLAQEWVSDGGQIYGGGKGIETEAIGNTYVNLKGAVFNGIKCVPNVLHAFAGGMQGNVVGRSNIYCDFQCPIATPMDAVNNCVWGSLYGGGREGSVVRHTQLLPGIEEPHENGTHVRVWSGQIDKVFGGSRIGNVEGASFVDINDKGENHFHTIIRSVYGGNDLSGTIGANQIPAMIEGNQPVRTSTYVLIRETPKSNGHYMGFPLITEVFGGSNGNYGTHRENKAVYASGEILTRDGKTIHLAGMPLPEVDSTYVEVRGGTIWYLYAGGNNSHVTKSSVIKVDYNDENVHLRAFFDKELSPECYERGRLMSERLKNDGGNWITENKVRALYNIMCVFGGNNKTPLLIQPTWILGQVKIHNLYGGCNKGDVWYYMNQENKDDNTPSLGLQLELDHPKLNINNVYGGCRIGNVQAFDIRVNPDSTYYKEPVTLKDNAYGTTIHIKNGKYGRIFGGNDISGKVLSGTRIQIEGGIIREVYGAGNGEYVYQYSNDIDKADAVYDPDLQQFVCLVPGKIRNADAFEKIKAIEEARPNTTKTYLEIAGGQDAKTGKRRMVYISKAVFAGGNCSTVVPGDNNKGRISVDLGDYAIINGVYLGSNGQQHIEQDYISNILKYNQITDVSQTDKNGRNILDYHMDAVMMHGLPKDFRFHTSYDSCYIGSFFLGGARGSLEAHGKLTIDFPKTLHIFGKIVGGADQAKVTYYNGSEPIVHEGGLLWDGIGEKPQIDLNVKCQFANLLMNLNTRYASQNYLYKPDKEAGDEREAEVYAGCFGSGRIEGEVNVNLTEEE